MLADGKYKARAQTLDVSITSKGTEQVVVWFDVVEGPCAGESAPWFGYLTPKARGRTLEALVYMGVRDVGDLDFSGYNRNVVEIVVEQNEYQGKTRARVQWVNKIGTAIGAPLDGSARKTLAAKLGPLFEEAKAKVTVNEPFDPGPVNEDEDDVPF